MTGPTALKPSPPWATAQTQRLPLTWGGGRERRVSRRETKAEERAARWAGPPGRGPVTAAKRMDRCFQAEGGTGKPRHPRASASSPGTDSSGRHTPQTSRGPTHPLARPRRRTGGGPPRRGAYLGRSAPAPSDGSGESPAARARARAPPPAREPAPALSVSVRGSQSGGAGGGAQGRSRARARQSPRCPRRHPVRCLRRVVAPEGSGREASTKAESLLPGAGALA